jgi:hypothetical protein
LTVNVIRTVPVTNGDVTILDIEVDGIPLVQLFTGRLGAHPSNVSALGWSSDYPANRAVIVDQFLGQCPSELESGRVPVLVCEMCGDVGCGALAVRITRDGKLVKWTDWADEDGDELSREVGWPTRPDELVFDQSNYESEIRKGLLLSGSDDDITLEEVGAETWDVVITCEDQFSAETQAGLLRNEGVPVEVRVKSPLPGLVSETQVLVPSSKIDVAHWIIGQFIIGQFKVSEAELYLAATGERITQDEASTIEGDLSRPDRHKPEKPGRRSSDAIRIRFIALMAGAALCYSATLKGLPGPWLGASRLLLALATFHAFWALFEAITSDKPPKSN